MLATLAGLAAAIWAFGSAGFANVLAATARVGPGGFVAFCVYSLAGFVPLGAAWLVAAPGEPASRVWLFSWARVLREAVSDLLPFSQIGGIVIGTRSLLHAGIAPTRVYASLVVDMTTEMAAQLVFTLFGLSLMASILMGSSAAALRPMIFGGTAAMIAVMILFFVAQRPALMLAERIAGHFLPGSAATMAGLLDTLRATYATRSRVIAAFAFNLVGWVASAFGAWLVLHLMGADVSVWSALSLESLIFTLRSVAFFIPAAIGVQEATYALAAPLFGLPAEMALALSLVKRARELAIGLPTLVIWQAREAKAVVAARLR
ncbi:lysylphosphatidylglycerol synthase domain-containing protein [Sphingomonas sp. Leaf357]|uniref:lysylphosphatidylglycerol synthase domain-containing protein n=1 Tax=Sphingomonas sp. Leaf357 TaxID=1736350 RepID=UPI0009E87EAC|nr:lysylphosphatidylglycerol synthase domain-containing protein [Sphingomonas sp. Leaf357]